MTTISQTMDTSTTTASFAGAVSAAPSRRIAAWRELATGPGPLWWRILRWSQRARIN